jgi:MarR family transcriptional regulator, 2-MHQ and catechol-resistance regulon repressor
MPETQTLTKHQQIALTTYTKMMRATNRVTARMHQHLGESKLTLSQFGVLEALYHLGPLCQRDIGEKILKTSGNITTVIDNLEKRKLVIRQQDKTDRRFMQVALTSQGRRLIGNLFPKHAAMAEEVFAVLSANEIDTLGRLLKKIGTAK